MQQNDKNWTNNKQTTELCPKFTVFSLVGRKSCKTRLVRGLAIENYEFE